MNDKLLNDKLLYLQQRLKAPKNQENTYGGYRYRSCEDILIAVKPLLKEYDLTLRLEDEIVQIGDRYYVKATAILRDDKEEITNVAYAREEDKKKEYEFYCNYAYQEKEDAEVWSIYDDFMDYEKWYGYGGARADNGFDTVDEIMKEWGFEKNNQLKLF